MKFFSIIAKIIILFTICSLFLTNKNTERNITERFSIITLTRAVDVYGKRYRENKDELKGREIKTLPKNTEILLIPWGIRSKHGYKSYTIYYFENGIPKLGYLLEREEKNNKYEIGKIFYISGKYTPLWYSYTQKIHTENNKLFFAITDEFLKEAEGIVFVSSDLSKQKAIKKRGNKILKTLIKPKKNIELDYFYYVPLKSYFKYFMLKRKYQKKYNTLYKYELPQYSLLERIKGIK